MAAEASTPHTADAADALSKPSFLTPERLKVLYIIGLVILAAAAVVWFSVTAARRKETYAASALDAARQAAAQGNMGVAVDGFTQVIKNYNGSAAAYAANLGIAKARLVTDQNELAIATLTGFIKTNPPAEYASPAHTLLGTAYENTAKYADAEVEYKKGAELAGLDYLKAANLLDAARAARLAGKADEAKAIYDDILSKYAKTGAKTEAEVRLAELTSAAAS